MKRALVALAFVGFLCGCRPLVIWEGANPDQTHRVQVRSSWRGQWVELNGKPGPAFPAVASHGLRFSKRGKRLAYPVRIKPLFAEYNKRVWGVHEHNKKPERFWHGVGNISFSPNGKHLAYSVQDSKGWRVVLDGKIGDRFKGVSRLQYSSDSSTLVFVAERKKGQIIVANNELVRQYRAIAGLEIGPAGRRIVATVRHKGRWHVSDNGRLSPPYRAIDAILLSNTGNDLAAIVRDGVGTRVILNGSPGIYFDKIRRTSLHFSTLGDVVYVGRRDGREFTVHGTKVGPGFERIDAPVTRGEQMGYIAHTATASHVIIAGKTVAKTVFARDLAFSTDGLRSAYVVRRGGGVSVIVGNDSYPFELVVPDSLVFAQSGHDWGCIVGSLNKKQLFIAVNGEIRRKMSFSEFMYALHLQTAGRTTRRKSIAALKRYVTKAIAE